MAAKDSSNKEQELRELLREEHQRRHEFVGNLQGLLSHWERELLEQRTGGEEATVPELLKRLQEVDDTLSPLLQQCQNLSLDVVNKREKGGSVQQAQGADRDSGLGTTPRTSRTSGDLEANRRHGTVMPRDLQAHFEEAFPEVSHSGNSSLDNTSQDDLRGQPRVPQEHTESSSDSEPSSSRLASPVTLTETDA